MKLSEHHSGQTTKLLLIGDSGSGKSGALASLALAGYNLYIIDFDNGLDILFNMLRPHPEALARVEYETVTDKFKMSGPRAVPTTARAWARMTELCTMWPGKGALTTFTTSDILVIDSLTFCASAAMRHYLMMNGKLADIPNLYDWNVPQTMVENLLALLFSSEIKCNIIVTSHIVQVGEDISVTNDLGKVVKQTRPGSERGFPASLGKALSPRIGRYFNACLLARSVPVGLGVERKIFTDSQGIVELKNSNPLNVKKEYPLKTGLADYFTAVRTSPVVGQVNSTPLDKDAKHA